MMAKKFLVEETPLQKIDSWRAKKIGNFISNKFDSEKKSLRLQVAKNFTQGSQDSHFEILLHVAKVQL